MKDESTIDPFATDLFLTGAAVARSRAYAAGRSSGSDWHRSLPKITEKELLASSNIASLPALPLESISRALARYTQSPPDLVSITQTALREHEPGAISTAPLDVPSAYACLLVGPDNAQIVLEADAQFAAQIIDRTLGGEGTPLDVLRGLSKTEHAVLEFLCLVLCREANAELEASLIRLAAVTSKQPEWLAADEQRRTGIRRLIGTFTVDVNGNRGTVRMHFSPTSVSELNTALSSEVPNRTGGKRGKATSLVTRKIRQYAALAPEVSLSMIVGQTEIAAGDLASLECGDVVVIQQASAGWVAGRLTGRLPMRVGDGDGAMITARVQEEDRGILGLAKAGETLTAPITVAIESFHAGNAATPEEGPVMEENSQEGGSGEGAALLDGLLLTVRVELAGRRMRMDELAQLRAGQILELGCRATDPVDLVIDGRSIARGELVDIEGRLGVRIAQVPA